MGGVGGGRGLDEFVSGLCQVEGFCEYVNVPWGSLKQAGNFMNG